MSFIFLFIMVSYFASLALSAEEVIINHYTVFTIYSIVGLSLLNKPNLIWCGIHIVMLFLGL